VFGRATITLGIGPHSSFKSSKWIHETVVTVRVFSCLRFLEYIGLISIHRSIGSG